MPTCCFLALTWHSSLFKSSKDPSFSRYDIILFDHPYLQGLPRRDKECIYLPMGTGIMIHHETLPY